LNSEKCLFGRKRQKQNTITKSNFQLIELESKITKVKSQTQQDSETLSFKDLPVKFMIIKETNFMSSHHCVRLLIISAF
jgi:hypothetical protein